MQIPVQEQLSFKQIEGVSGSAGLAAGLLAIATDNSLWYTTQDNNDNWNANLFTQIPNIPGPNGGYLPYYDVAGVWIGLNALPAQALLIMTLVSNPYITGPEVYCLYGQCLLPNTNTLRDPMLVWSSIPGGVAPASMAALSFNKLEIPTAVVALQFAAVGDLGGGDIEFFVTFTSADNQTWLTFSQNSLAGQFPPPTALAVGNSGTLQLFGLPGTPGAPFLAWDTSDIGSTFVPYELNGGQLPNQTSIDLSSITFTALAAANGNNSNLQVVGITGGPSPFLFWQDAASGNWVGCIQLPTGPNVPAGLLDLCMGMGNQGYLQVGYLGTDQNVYVSFQDTSGNWGWYGPLP